MSTVDVSILIVHTFEKHQIRQTIRSIRRAAPKISYEIILIDNNPTDGLMDVLTPYDGLIYLPQERNLGFGGGMNKGIEKANVRYILVFNPDIIVQPGSLEAMVEYMEAHPEVGICGPKLMNPDGTLQYSCYRQPNLLIPVYRRTPLGRLSFAKKTVDDYLMTEMSHDEEMPVDSLIGAALFARAELLAELKGFDERFFLYYEDNDLCRRTWLSGKAVMYYPESTMIHYHRRATADGGFWRQIRNKMTWIQIHSALKYHLKYRGEPNPRRQFAHANRIEQSLR
ncbi:MAG: glycosyltransferase family 2 protein [bacterium]|nr:glycosyltransferase family 2 protein [bacterium]